MTVMIQVENLNKRFTLHNQGGVSYPVLNNVSFEVNAGECVVLDGRSGSGKSTLLRSLYANYKPQSGHIRMRHQGALIDLTTASAREVLAIRRQTLGYVSQFLRVIPRVSALEVVMEPLRNLGVDRDTCRQRAASLLQQLNVPETLWHLPPSTFSGGEQQRVNIARGFVVDYPVLLLDEPTASLDAQNRDVVITLIHQARQRGAAIVGIFHDADVRDHLADRTIPVGNSNREYAA
ncbi:phosphonate C-P lyase system protein PhnL [Marinobacter lacisalsi]|uniref:Phosphonate C-P lyase system protein PhnL n=1 Tax=Marinobacter lacisalsi TaxID=475979 RepID=A0ABV8QH38_9GAMM